MGSCRTPRVEVGETDSAVGVRTRRRRTPGPGGSRDDTLLLTLRVPRSHFSPSNTPRGRPTYGKASGGREDSATDHNGWTGPGSVPYGPKIGPVAPPTVRVRGEGVSRTVRD